MVVDEVSMGEIGIDSVNSERAISDTKMRWGGETNWVSGAELSCGDEDRREREELGCKSTK